MTKPVIKKMMEKYGLPYDEKLLKETADLLSELYWNFPVFEYETEASAAGAIYLIQWEKGNFDDAKFFLSYLDFEQKNIVRGKEKRKEEPKHNKSKSESNQSHKENKNEHTKGLTEEQQRELKQKYREIVKKCHPDKVDNEQKKQAEDVFRRAKDAYDENDLETISEIHSMVTLRER